MNRWLIIHDTLEKKLWDHNDRMLSKLISNKIFEFVDENLWNNIVVKNNVMREVDDNIFNEDIFKDLQ